MKHNNMKRIPLTQGKVALVDDDFYEYLNQFKWCVKKNRDTFYAIRHVMKKGNTKRIWMHREILNSPEGMLTDHRDGDGLNNQRSNLRVCSHVQNNRNRRMRLDNSSGYKGVQWRKDREKWRAIIKVGQKLKHIGNFTSKIEAAKAYDKAAKKYFGKFAKLNF